MSATYNTILVCPMKKEFSDKHEYHLNPTPVHVPHVGVMAMPEPSAEDRCEFCSTVLLLIDIDNNLRRNVVSSGVKSN